MPGTRPARNFEDLLRGVSRSFFLSIRVLPAPLRRPIGLAYLLARATDTVADTAAVPTGQRQATLASLSLALEPGTTDEPGELRSLLAQFVAQQTESDERRLMLALPDCLAALRDSDAADRSDIQAVLRHITRGQMLDIERFAAPGCHAIANAAQLDEYTYLVAGSVGEFWTDVCVRHLPRFARLPAGRMRQLGRDYGCGLQLVNIVRDAHADLAQGRCYFPADELAAAGLTAEDAARQPERLAPVWLRWHAAARDKLAHGMDYALAVDNRRVRAATALPALLGARTLGLVQAAGARALSQRIRMPRAEVRAVAWRMLFTLAGRAGLRHQFDRLGGQSAAAGWDNPDR